MEAQAERLASESHDNVRAPEWVWGLWAVGLLFVNCLTFPLGVQSKWPPDLQGAQFVAEFAGAVFAGFCLWRSALSVFAWRVFYAVMLITALVFTAMPMASYFWQRSDYPWPSAILILLGVLVGSWLAHQRWLLIALPAFLGWWFWGALQSPTTSLPEVQTAKGVSIQLSDVRRNGCKVRIVANKHDAKDFVDAEALQVDASAGSNISIWSVEPYFGGLERDYSGMHTAPSWVRNLDIKVTLPVFPSEPLVSVRIPLGVSDPADVQQTSNGAFVRIKDMRWLNSHKDLGVAITLSVPDSGWTLNDFRVSDDQARDVDLTLSQSSWDDKEITLKAEAKGLSPHTKWLRIDLYSAAQIAASQIVFNFERVPIG